MRNPHRAIETFLDRDPSGADPVMDLIPPSVVSHGKVVAQGPLGPNAQNIVQV